MSSPKRRRGWLKTLLGRPNPDFFLDRISGLIHIGASTGQERDLYAGHNLDVAWVEPIPEVFAQLQESIAGYPRQKCFNYLVADQDGKEFPFHISSNQGHSSSILPLSVHKELWPEVDYVQTLVIPGITLPTLVAREQIDLDLYQALVLDTQGSELLILQGMIPLLPRFKYILCEVADFEAYVGCCQLDGLTSFLRGHGFRFVTKKRFMKSAVGNYYDATYERRA